MNGNLGGQYSCNHWDTLPAGFTSYQSQEAASRGERFAVSPGASPLGHLWSSSSTSSLFSTEAIAVTEQTKGAHPTLPSPKEGSSSIEYIEDQMTAFVAEHNARVQDLRRFFQMPTDSSVTAFLDQHRSLPQLLMEATAHLMNCFGSSTIFALHAEIDESGSRTLYATAVWSGRLQDVRRALDRFDKDWWMSHAGQGGGYLTFTYELV
jgi:hypothetical protein